MNWDLIQTAAIRSVGVVSNNPAYGLNALGGALDIQMKNGFNYQGAEINTMAGSYGRIARGNGAIRELSTTNIRRFYGDVGYKTDTSEIHMNMGAADMCI